MSARPLLVTGSHRSGTTWVGQVLALAPEFVYAFEPFNPDMRPSWLRAPVSTPYLYVTEQNENENTGVVESLARAFELKFPFLAAIRRGEILNAPRFALKNALSARRARYRGGELLLKDPLALLSAPWIADKFRVNVLVTVRHPAAFVMSLVDKGWCFDFNHLLQQEALIDGPFSAYAGEICAAAKCPPSLRQQASLLWKLLYSFVREQLESRSDVTIVRHEDVAADPCARFSELFRQYEVTAPPNLNAIFNGEVRGRRDLAVPNSIDRWKQRLSDRQINMIREDVADIGAHFYNDSSWVPRETHHRP